MLGVLMRLLFTVGLILVAAKLAGLTSLSWWAVLLPFSPIFLLIAVAALSLAAFMLFGAVD